MNEILIDQIKTVFPHVEISRKEGIIESITLKDTQIEGVLLRVTDRGLSIDFSNFKKVDMKNVKLFFIDRLRYPKTALYDYHDKNILNLYFQKKFYSDTKMFEEAMWKYDVFKKVVSQLEMFSKFLEVKES